MFILNGLRALARLCGSSSPNVSDPWMDGQEIRVPPEVVQFLNSDVEEMSLSPLIGLKGKPKSLPPLVMFRYKQDKCSFQVGINAPPGQTKKPAGVLPRYNLMCPVCHDIALSEEARHGVHVTMKHWGSIALPVCGKCTELVSDPANLNPGRCFCCFSREASSVLERQDNHLCLLLCDFCVDTEWRRMVEAAGVSFCVKSLPVDGLSAVASAVLAENMEKMLAAHNAQRKRPATPPPPERKRQCGEIVCHEEGCEATTSIACLSETFGSFANVYVNGNLPWRCEEHE